MFSVCDLNSRIENAEFLDTPIEVTDFMVLLNFDEIEPIEELPLTSIDIYDDQDIDKDGTYFTLEGSKIKYEVFENSRLLLATHSFQQASRKHQEVFNSSFKEIKYYSKQGD